MNDKTKEWIQYGCAIGMLLSGVALTFLCFLKNNDVKDNVLIYVGQCLMFAGGIFGVSIYFRSKGKQLMDELKTFLKPVKKNENLIVNVEEEVR